MIRLCLALTLCFPCAAALAWGCNATGPVLGDAPSRPGLDASIVDARSDRDAGADACPNDLSNVGTGDFHISCTLTTTQTPIVALANQRDWCFNRDDLWDLRMEAGVPVIEIDDEAGPPHYTRLWSSGPPIDDGRPHDILVERVSGILSINIDGMQTASTAAPASFGTLPSMVVGSDICIGVDGTVALVDPLANVCVGKQ